MRPALCVLAVVVALLAAPVCAQHEAPAQDRPVKAVGDKLFLVSAPEGSGTLRYFGTGSLDGDTRATRALIVIHGLLRNADEYERTGEQVLAAAKEAGANTLLITPQFLAQLDVTALSLPPDTLRWDTNNWNDGYPALGPAPLSAYSALDAVLLRLADRARFPALREIVLAGHSAGAQMVQRYAVVGRAPDALVSGSPAVRFVVANPSSYLYFDGERPHGDGFAPYDAAACPSYDHWKYGPDGPPPYVSGSIADLEGRYVARNVTYLLGLLDTDPNHPVLDKSCSGEAEGPYRLARGESYARYLKQRHPSGTAQSLADVPGVDHDGLGMFTSPCGIAVLFNEPRTACVRPEQI